MKNVVLIGMPGAGKSTVGVVLAKKLGLHFVDCDLVIQEQTGKLLHEIIEEKGLDGFLQVENDCIAQLWAENAVIATGGSAVYEKEAMEHLKANGRVIYLQLSYENVRKRLGDLKKRGVALREGQSLKELYRERTPLYERYADRTVACKGKKIREIVGETASWVRRQEAADTKGRKPANEKDRKPANEKDQKPANKKDRKPANGKGRRPAEKDGRKAAGAKKRAERGTPHAGKAVRKEREIK